MITSREKVILRNIFNRKKFLRLPVHDEDIELIALPETGSSGARVFTYISSADHRAYTIKKHITPRVHPRVELRRRDELAAYLGEDRVPKILNIVESGGYHYTVSETPSTLTLAGAFLNQVMSLKAQNQIWMSVIQSLSDLWLETAEPCDPKQLLRNPYKRVDRIRQGLAESRIGGFKLDGLMDRKIEYGGELYPSVNDMLDCAAEIKLPGYSVMCHGDPQPANILIDKKNQWSLVDWEWSGRQHDWRMMLSHMHGWWAYRYCNIFEDAVVAIKQDRIIITSEFQVFQPQMHKLFQNSVANLYQGLQKECLSNGHEQDVADINRYLICLYLGDIRFLPLWSREHIATSLLLESAKLTKQLQNKNGCDLKGSPFLFTGKTENISVPLWQRPQYLPLNNGI